MNNITKLLSTVFTMLFSIVMFAQEREVRPTRYAEPGNEGVFPNVGGPEENAVAPGGGLVPINDYEWILVAIAGAIIMYFAFRAYQAKRA